MLRSAILLVLLLVSQVLNAQTAATAEPYLKTITVEDLRSRLEIIASDEFEGRETGTAGQKKAAQYIQARFYEFGLAAIPAINGYLQSFKLQYVYPDSVKLKIGAEPLEFLKDMYYFAGFGDMTLESNELVYLGYGVETKSYNDYASGLAKGKVVMVSSGEPVSKKKISWVTGTSELSNWTSDWTKKIESAKSNGAKALLIIDDNLSSSVSQYGRYIKRPDLHLSHKIPDYSEAIPLIYISGEKADALLKAAGYRKGHGKLQTQIDKSGEPHAFELDLQTNIVVNKRRELVYSENVLGYMEGTEKPDELLVISSHYDHLGKKDGQIFNGADDDGSGTTALLEIAEAFAQAKKAGHGPKRSILFMAFSGEEKGLLGSEYYTDKPVFPLSSTVANLNIDMIGRIDENHAPDSNYVYIIGSDKLSTELHALNENLNKEFSKIEFDYTYNDENDPNRFYYRSDHYNFAKNNIPVIFYFTGVHEDYHQPTDTVDKIMFPKMERIVKHIFLTAWEIANRDDRLNVDVKPAE